MTAVVCALPHASFAQTVRIPGTSVTLAPPEGFSLAQQYPGFEREDLQASIMVTQLPVAAADMIRSMTKPALASKGMVLVSARDATIKGNPARVFHVRQNSPTAEVLKWMLVAGDTKTTVMVVGTFPANASPEVGDAIQRSLLSASWGSTATPGPFEGLSFQVTPTNQLKLAQRVSNMLMFTESGTTGSPGSTEALYIAGHSLGKGQIGDVRTFSESRAKQTTLMTNFTNFTGRPIQVAGLHAFELEGDGTDPRSGQAMRLYQVIIPDETGYFILQGLCRVDRAKQIFPEFRALTASFQIVAPR
jgi:hypothetical protein